MDRLFATVYQKCKRNKAFAAAVDAAKPIFQ
jgi:hypothetical protein